VVELVSADPEVHLMSRVAAGDAGDPLGELIGRYSRPLFGLGLRLLGDRGLAEELVQDSFVRIWRNAHSFDPERGSVRTFVYTIARRAAIDLQRRSKRVPLPVEPNPADRALGTDPAAADPFERLLVGIEVRDAMAALSGAHREVLELYYDAGLTQRQIAERLGVPLGTVKTRTYHALRAMRAELEGRGFDV
jgi:RNA polymerase sigma-70 factor, ECF subfamily